jgi:hypothetical protein
MYLYATPRSYLIAGFTAASIVAAIPMVPKPTVHLPSTHSIETRLTAADSQIASSVRELGALETRALAAVEHTTTTNVVPGVARRSPTIADSQRVPSSSTASSRAASNAGTSPTVGTTQHGLYATTNTTAAQAITPANLLALIGDASALGLDLVGTPFAAVAALSMAGDVAIADLDAGMTQNVSADVGKSLENSLEALATRLSADINLLGTAENQLRGVPAPASGAEVGDPTGTANTSTSTTDPAPPRTASGSSAPTGVGPLVDAAATLGLDVFGTPFQLTAALTTALSDVALDLGTGDFQDAGQAFAVDLRSGFTSVKNRLVADIDNIKAALAGQMAGPVSSAPGDSASAKSGAVSAKSIAQHSSTSPAQLQAGRPAIRPRHIVSQTAPSTPGAPSAGPNRQPSTAHNRHVSGVAVTDPSTSAAPTAKSSTSTTTKPSPTKAGNSTGSAHTATAGSGKQGANGPKHRKH